VTDRSIVDPDVVGARSFYQLLTAVVVPRPIAWVSTTSADGIDNLAPHSFFTVACTDPPIVQFTSVGAKDSLRNVEATGEFVVNFAPVWLYEQVNATGTEFARDVDEFAAAGIEREPSSRVRPPRVSGSPVALECIRHSTIKLGDSTVVLGRVVAAAIDPDVLDGAHPRIDRLRPLARLGRDEWAVLGEIREIARIKPDEWPGHYAAQLDR
jgi:flavin reductase (DIM6/NTAB) family NADH-FMN oxidoreductase RutF